MKRIKYGTSILLFITLVTAVFVTVSTLTGQKSQDVASDDLQPEQICDLTDFNFESIANLSGDLFTWYPNAYYTPDDFSQGRVDTAAVSYSQKEPSQQYGTLRLRVALEAGQIYALSGYSANYAQRLYINTLEYPAVGSPGDSAQTNTAKTAYFIAAFEPEDGIADIVIHMSNFVHSNGGGLLPLNLGYQWQITQAYQASQLRTNIIVGCMVTGCLLFFGLLFFFPDRRQLLWISLTCLAVALRTLIVEQKTIMILFESMRWETSIRLEYLAMIGLLSFLLLYIHEFFGRPLGTWFEAAVGSINGTAALAVILLQPLTTTKYLFVYQYVMILVGVAAILACVRNTIRSKSYRSPEHLLFLTAVVLFAVFATVDTSLYLAKVEWQYQTRLLQTGMMVFLFVNMLVQILGFFRTEHELQQVQQTERELLAQRDLLDRLNNLKTDYLNNISHEIKTPLSVMAGYAQLTYWQVEQGTAGPETLENLKAVSAEAQRLAGMAEQILTLSTQQAQIGETKEIRLQDTCAQVNKLSEPLLHKNNNRFTWEAEESCPPVQFHPDSMIQILLNLISNANRHTQNGSIHLSVRQEGDFAAVTLTDNGSGIDPAQIPYLFQRGFSPDSRTGLGLALCKEMVEDNGGEIHISSTLGQGTSVTFTLPICKQKQERENHA
ncbi:MAG: HAMP domain-containing histidine kinase [Clostridiales bacterium]|nr:HAMP domain-containing histidine kinase [Clostridiales bacterium]